MPTIDGDAIAQAAIATAISASLGIGGTILAITGTMRLGQGRGPAHIPAIAGMLLAGTAITTGRAPDIALTAVAALAFTHFGIWIATLIKAPTQTQGVPEDAAQTPDPYRSYDAERQAVAASVYPETPLSAPAPIDQSQLAPRFRAGYQPPIRISLATRAARRIRWAMEDAVDAAHNHADRILSSRGRRRAERRERLIGTAADTLASSLPRRPMRTIRSNRTVRLATPIDAAILSTDPTRPSRIAGSLLDQIGGGATITGVIVESDSRIG